MLRVISPKDSRIPKGATLLAINKQKIEDVLEFRFYNDITKLRKVLIETDGSKINIIFKPNEKIMAEFEEPHYRQCENNCDFCFINGLPKGLRKELYFRDDDYRLSFLFGNFLSLTNINEYDISRIGRLKLSPLYVSVHTTTPNLRAKLFKNNKADLIMNQLRSLIDNNIRLHCQIVLIPGVGDGTDIIKTINDLGRLFPGVASIGVVPVGKTKYLRGISLISEKLARKTIGLVETLHKKFRQKYKKGIVYCADEFYIKAGFPIPETSYYDDFPQHENGIGIVRLFIDEIKGLNRIKKIKGKFLILAGISALPFLNMLKMKLTRLGCIDNNNIKIKGVENSFFGNSVTVSGLIGAHDFARTITGQDKTFDHIILPPNCINDSAEFIDDKTIDDKRVLISPDSVKELLQCLQ